MFDVVCHTDVSLPLSSHRPTSDRRSSAVGVSRGNNNKVNEQSLRSRMWKSGGDGGDGGGALAVLVLAAGGRDAGLGQEELPAGTHAHLEQPLGVSGDPLLAQRQARHAHRLGVQHQLQQREQTVRQCQSQRRRRQRVGRVSEP